jgi:hypothetical protein
VQSQRGRRRETALLQQENAMRIGIGLGTLVLIILIIVFLL